ncbi:hypothetical protein UFOVP1444_31 [uncultured Caudovirales phage]|uniref:DUF4177 domain-containing protein n=1 Tax=uncultured Caudovirales phage TaxID=2100421 RepID=A0A6J7XDQ6_9CAUD|nr:hypothetical protein UFOVP1444_31 [uncultured Caudovirales phage]CAB5227949.1 hypothetical protein UFOVP1536_19 [uncultured Caudovirales phage]
MKYEYKIWSPTSDMANEDIEKTFNAYGESGWAFISRDAVGRNVFMKIKSATSTATTVVDAPVRVSRGRNRPRP